MRITAFRGERSITELVDKFYRDLTPATRRSAEQALLKANPHLAALHAVREGAVLVIPDVSGARGKFQRGGANPAVDLLATVTDALGQYRQQLARNAKTEAARVNSEIKTLADKEIQHRLADSAELKQLAAALESSLKQRAGNAKAVQEFAGKTLDRADQDIKQLIDALN